MKRTKSEIKDFTTCDALDTKGLMETLSCGYNSAVALGAAAGARVKIGKRVLWNMKKVRKYLDEMSE